MTPEAKTKQVVQAMLTISGAYFFMPFGGGYGRAGIPDVVACIRGHFLAIECKAGKGKTTALQDRELQRIMDAGGESLVVYDTPTAYAQLQDILNKLKG